MPRKKPRNSQRSAKRPRGLGRPFPKGKSGNPKGRPPIPAEYKAALSLMEPIALDVLGEILADKRHPRRQQTAEYIINRQRGTPVSRAEITGPNGEPVKVTYEDVRQKLTALAERVANAGAAAPEPHKE